MNGEPVIVEAFDSVFDALADTPAEAANLTMRADLLLSIRERVKSSIGRICQPAAKGLIDGMAESPARPEPRTSASSTVSS